MGDPLTTATITIDGVTRRGRQKGACGRRVGGRHKNWW